MSRQNHLFKVIKRDAASLYDEQYAANTIKSHKKWRRIWEIYCRTRQTPSFPAQEKHICQWLQSNSHHYQFSSLKLFVAMLSFMHKKHNYPNPLTDKVQWTLTSIARRIGVRKAQANAITEADWTLICNHLNRSNSLAASRNYCMLALLRCCMLRLSEVLAIRVCDIRDDMLLVARSKTDQFGEGVELYIPKSYKNIVDTWVGFCKQEFNADSYLFIPITRYGIISSYNPMSTVAANKIIKRIVKDAGIGKAISGHSFRVGMTQSLAEFGCGLPEIQQAGRWKSPTMPGYYIRNSERKIGAVAKYHRDKSYV